MLGRVSSCFTGVSIHHQRPAHVFTAFLFSTPFSFFLSCHPPSCLSARSDIGEFKPSDGYPGFRLRFAVLHDGLSQPGSVKRVSGPVPGVGGDTWNEAFPLKWPHPEST